MQRTGLGLTVALLSATLGACTQNRIACPIVTNATKAASAASTALQAEGQSATADALMDCPPPIAYPFTNLVFEGGGVKGIAYGGSLSALSDQGILPRIERVAGTSAGAITATLVALGYSASEIRALLGSIDFKSFEDGGSTGFFRLLRRFGWYRGDNYLELMRCLVAGKTGNPRATFADLHRLRMRDLHVFATDLNTRAAKEFSYATTPDAEVAVAARTSGSFPVFFAAMFLAGDVFVDGGVLRNYPVDAFDTEEGLNYGTLGFVLENTGAPPKRYPVGDLRQYTDGLIEALLSVQTENLSVDPANLERTVVLDDLGISTLDFELTDAQKQSLVDKGEECTCSYLTEWQKRRSGANGAPSKVRHAERPAAIAGGGRCGWILP
jgi:NTE family protein